MKRAEDMSHALEWCMEVGRACAFLGAASGPWALQHLHYYHHMGGCQTECFQGLPFIHPIYTLLMGCPSMLGALFKGPSESRTPVLSFESVSQVEYVMLCQMMCDHSTLIGAYEACRSAACMWP